eukprot:2663932-Lingulodinium_polyedra.AAC.1
MIQYAKSLTVSRTLRGHVLAPGNTARHGKPRHAMGSTGHDAAWGVAGGMEMPQFREQRRPFMHS